MYKGIKYFSQNFLANFSLIFTVDKNDFFLNLTTAE